MGNSMSVELDSTPPEAGNTTTRKRWLRAGIALGTLVILAGSVFFYLHGRRYVVELTEAQLQEGLNRIFPVQKSFLEILSVTLSDPQVHLVDGADRISFGSKATLNVTIGQQKKPLGGQSTISTELRYDPDTYSFYLENACLESLEVQGIPVQHVEAANHLARKLAQNRLDSTPVYTLRQDSLKQSTARLVLKGMKIKDQKLVIVLGL